MPKKRLRGGNRIRNNRRPKDARVVKIRPRRGLELVIEGEDGQEDITDSNHFGGQIWGRLGSKGRFVAISFLIAIAITISKIYYDRVNVEAFSFVDEKNQSQIGLGKKLYQANCAFCHGDNREGQPLWNKTYINGKRPAPPLNLSGYVPALSNRELFDITKYGGQPFAPKDYINEMPSFEMLLKDNEIWAIVAFLRSSS
ncbi:MAG: cytochrome c [Nisaea sp.]|nr:cytochrome c [Nisaea sp.]MEC7972069.1 cytochrome c [Pseudomonadota bacterium]